MLQCAAVSISQQLVPVLVLLALLLPTVGAILARLIGRKFGPRATQSIGALGFAIALGSAIALQWIDVDRDALGSLGIFVPDRGPLIDAEAFTLPRRALATQAAGTPIVLALAEPSPTLEAPTSLPTPSASSTRQPTATARPTTAITPSPAMTASPTVAPTAEPASLPRPTARPPTPTIAPARAQAYFVKPGDTLRSIAAKLDLSVDALLSYNGLSRAEGDRLQLDQKLYIPSSSSAQAAEARPPARPPTPTSRPAAKAQLYVVKPGDTLRSISAKFDISVDALLRYNGLSPEEGDQLQLDQKLYIPPS